MKTRPLVLLAAAALSGIASTRAALQITLDFSGFSSASAPTASLYGVTGDATAKNEAVKSVVEAAVQYWESAFDNSTRSLSQTIAVTWSSRSPGVLATGGTSWYGGPDFNIANGTLTLDNDGSSSFFVDATPWENSEWLKSSLRTQDFGGGAINAERVFYDAADTGTTQIVFGHSDLLSVAIHEVGHALGFLSSYPRYTAADTGNDGDLDVAGGSEIPYTGSHLSYSMSQPSGFPATGWTYGGAYEPADLSASLVQGTRVLLSEADILALAQVQGMDNVNTNPTIIPEPAAAWLAMTFGFLFVTRRRRGA